MNEIIGIVEKRKQHVVLIGYIYIFLSKMNLLIK